MSIAVGIDLGTTNTVVAAVRDGLAFTIADPNGRRLIPSTVSFHPSGNVLVGEPAVARRLVDPENTVYSVKRLIGRPWNSEEVQRARGRFPFKMKEGPKFGTIVVARGEEYTLPEISAFVLRYAKATAEAALGVPVDKAVITVPANFNDLQRAATKVAGKLAGLEVLRILNEPTAAALAYGQGAAQGSGLAPAVPDPVAKGERVAVYDLGGGTFDITLLDLSGSVFEVLATAGDTSLGGDDFDTLVAEKMADEMLKKVHFDARTDPQAFGRLRMAAEQLKKELSTKDEAIASLDDVAPGVDGKKQPFSFKMTRTELEWASLPLVDRTFKVCQEAADRAQLQVPQIDRIILVGGSTRMPLVGRRVEQFFQKPPVMRVNPDEVVALGAALQAAALDRTGRRRTGPGVTQPTPTISEQSMVAPPPEPKPRAAAARGDHDPAPPELPLVLGRTASVHLRGAAPAAPSMERDAATTAAEDPVMPIGMGGNLELELPQPDAPPKTATSQGRPLVFDLPKSVPPPPAAPPPVPQKPPLPPAARTLQMDAPPTPALAFGELSALSALPEPAPEPILQQVPGTRPPLLIDVTPLSLAVETVGGFCDTLIEANTPVPCDRTRIFLTASDGQTQVSVRVAQGPSTKFAENTFLGECVLTGIAPAARGEAKIAVTFEIDADGILNVKAKDQETGNETRAKMQLVGAQTEEHELAAMQARQARHAVG